MAPGFGDVPSASDDNDFQDFVISIRTNADGLCVVEEPLPQFRPYRANSFEMRG